jgi:hypothetical protein
MKLTKHISEMFSMRGDYSQNIAAIESAVQSGSLRLTDKKARATDLVDTVKGWRSRMEGIDWIRLQAYAEDNKMPFETVGDMLNVLKSLNVTK